VVRDSLGVEMRGRRVEGVLWSWRRGGGGRCERRSAGALRGIVLSVEGVRGGIEVLYGGGKALLELGIGLRYG
jgi:hypothetical protein